MWVTMGSIFAVALGIGIYLMIGAMRNGATFLEVLPPAALLVFGIALAAILLVVEGKITGMQYDVAGVTYYISLGIPSIISIAVCMGIAKVWGKMFGKTPPSEEKAQPNEP